MAQACAYGLQKKKCALIKGTDQSPPMEPSSVSPTFFSTTSALRFSLVALASMRHISVHRSSTKPVIVQGKATVQSQYKAAPKHGMFRASKTSDLRLKGQAC